MCESDTTTTKSKEQWEKISASLWSSSALHILPPTPPPASYPEEDDVNFKPELLDSPTLALVKPPTMTRPTGVIHFPDEMGLTFGTVGIAMGGLGLSGGYW
jgi:hypothetical protein